MKAETLQYERELTNPFEPYTAPDKLFRYFTDGTQNTVTGQRVGMEIETSFVDQYGRPITVEQSRAILARGADYRPSYANVKRELGQQMLELNLDPQRSRDDLFGTMYEGLYWLYGIAAEYGAFPLTQPDFDPASGLLVTAEDPRDDLWLQMDGRGPLEQLTRCSSVQFTVDVNPEDAIPFLNNARGVSAQYRANNMRWEQYIAGSRANYRADRYKGPSNFADMGDYVRQLTQNNVVMEQGRAHNEPIENFEDFDRDLFLRSVWWGNRLRRYGDTLAVEMRQFGRCPDENIPNIWADVASQVGISF